MASKNLVDREKMCPFLLRVLWIENSSHEVSYYTDAAQQDNPYELHIHTWMDANLREITNALKTAVKCANDKDARLHFYHVFQDSSGKFKKKSVSTIHSVRKDNNDKTSLSDVRFQIGDCLDVEINTKAPPIRQFN